MITLEEAKLNTHIDDDYSDEILQRHLDGAISHCLRYLNRSVYKTPEEVEQAQMNGDSSAILFDQIIFSAICIQFTWLAENKAGENSDSKDKAICSLLRTLRKSAGI